MGDTVYATPSEARTPIEELLELALNPGRPAWHAEAACRGKGPAMFFPERGQASEPARAVCAGCPVVDDCRAWALAQPHHEVMGVWGGMSGRERRLHHLAAEP